MELNNLPAEVLCQIFDYMDVYELKLASLVCLRWSELTFSGRRMDRVCLVTRDSNSDFLFNTKRKYRNVRQRREKNYQLESLVRLLHMLKPNVRELHFECHVTSEQLRLLLLEAPELQHLKIDMYIESCEMNGPFPVLAKLEKLVLNGVTNDLLDFFRRSMPNLQSLYMDCMTDFELKAWKCLTGQLKVVHVTHLDETYLHSFLELTFPILEEFVVDVDDDDESDLQEMIDDDTNNDFFRRHPFLRRLYVPLFIPVQWVESISRHCPELTYLYLLLKDPEEGYLESLVQLTKLKHLSLTGETKRKMFRGAFKLLESVTLYMPKPRVLLENLFEGAPRLTDMTLHKGIYNYELQFVCERFSCLQHLRANIAKVTAAENSVRFDRLDHLQELKLWGFKDINYIHRNNVPCLTISFCKLRDGDINKIPEKFPALKRLIFEGYYGVSLAGVERLHKLMPYCRIDFGDERFYPVDNGTSK